MEEEFDNKVDAAVTRALERLEKQQPSQDSTTIHSLQEQVNKIEASHNEFTSNIPSTMITTFDNIMKEKYLPQQEEYRKQIQEKHDAYDKKFEHVLEALAKASQSFISITSTMESSITTAVEAGLRKHQQNETPSGVEQSSRGGSK